MLQNLLTLAIIVTFSAPCFAKVTRLTEAEPIVSSHPNDIDKTKESVKQDTDMAIERALERLYRACDETKEQNQHMYRTFDVIGINYHNSTATVSGLCKTFH